MSDILKAPWTDEQVATLNRYQRDSRFHPFTCGSENRRDARHMAAVFEHNLQDAGQLHATVNGWVCMACKYTQDWALTVMLTALDNRNEFERKIRNAAAADTVE